MTLEETIAEIKRQGGLVYVPHPFDRMHSVPDYEHLLAVVEDIDAIEVFNPRIAIPAFNEEAVRFAGQVPDRRRRGLGRPRRAGPRLACASGCATSTGPEEFLESLRDADIVGRPSSLYYVQVQALKFLQTQRHAAGRAAGGARAARSAARLGAQALMQGQGEPRRGGQTPRRNAGHRRRDPREVPRARDPRAQPLHARPAGAARACPRGNLMPVLGSGHPQADVFLLKYAPTRRGDRGGRRLLRPLRHRADEVAQAARHRPARRLRDAVRQVPGGRHRAGRARSASRGWSRRSRSCSRRSSW